VVRTFALALGHQVSFLNSTALLSMVIYPGESFE
jgi:hypothetical protein